MVFVHSGCSFHLFGRLAIGEEGKLTGGIFPGGIDGIVVEVESAVALDEQAEGGGSAADAVDHGDLLVDGNVVLNQEDGGHPVHAGTQKLDLADIVGGLPFDKGLLHVLGEVLGIEGMLEGIAVAGLPADLAAGFGRGRLLEVMIAPASGAKRPIGVLRLEVAVRASWMYQL